ncbi:MAG: hypothetical protein EP330_31200 [Deltaproteobacteria bacterium]|nr:MAG: hypothetical protein EP330_31200 [Deltaproteobacteria bacterium]
MEVAGTAPPLAELNACGSLTYGLYPAEGETTADHRLPDFSFAGYRKGGVALPSVPTVVTLSPQTGDDRARIQAAIDQVEARTPDGNGHRGAVLLTAGAWEVSDTLTIEASGVVLRGEGQGSGGTVLRATQAAQHTLIRVQGGGSGLPQRSTPTAVVGRVPVGSRGIEVADASAIAIGDVVAVERTPNDAWITDLGVDAWGWTADSYAIRHEREVTDIDGNVLTIDVPIVDAMDPVYGGGQVFVTDVSGRIEEVGVEDLRLVSDYASSTDEAHGWIGVELRRTTNSWVSGVTAVHFGYAAVSIAAQSSFNTVEDCAMLDPVSQVTGGRRYSFNLDGGVGNLFQRLYSEEARHDFVSGSRTTGPNVWLDGLSMASSSDDGPHHRWATGLLFDNVLSYELHVENRQDSGSGHGWSGAQTLFWNAVADGIRADAPRGAMNWTVGSMGTQQEGGWTTAEPFGWWESHGTPVDPRSLYLQQLQDRLGSSAVEAVTLPSQRDGRIWGELATWAGEGSLAAVTQVPGDPTCDAGIANGLACCDSACGTCGGTGCGSLPGGSGACCVGSIVTSGVSCDVASAPCILDPDFSPL